MPLVEPVSLSSIGKIISLVWANGSRVLWSISLACAAAAGILYAAAHFGINNGQAWWDAYGLILMMAAAAVGVFAGFKQWAEQASKNVFLVADEDRSFWHHVEQQDGRTTTQFGLKFHVTNDTTHPIYLQKIRILWPWVYRKQMLSTHLATQSSVGNDYSETYAVPQRTRRACAADVIVVGALGGAGRRKSMRVTVKVQDNRGRWYKIAYPHLRDPQLGPM